MAKNKVEITGINTSTLKTISSEEMNNLFIELQKGNKNAKNTLIEGNLKLVLSILKKYQNRCDNLDDLFQIGTIGLIKAIDNFDLSFGVKFSTYAVLMIEGEIKRYIRDNNQIRISRTIKELSYQIINYKETYLKQNGVYPSNDEICSYFNITPYELYNVLSSLTEPMSIFEPIYNDGGDTIYLCDQVSDKSNNKDLDLSIAVERAISKLTPREQFIIDQRFIIGKTQMEIAESLGISQAQISRLEKDALTRVRKQL